MQVIKGTLNGTTVYYVGSSGDQVAWSMSISDAMAFDPDDDIEEAIKQLNLDSPTVTCIESLNADCFGQIFKEEFDYVVKEMRKAFNHMELSQRDLTSVVNKFKSLVREDEYPAEYLALLNVSIQNSKVVIHIPETTDILRLRTLH